MIKEKIDFDYLRSHGMLLFEYVRGSHLYGLNTETSDVDTGGVYIEPLDACLGLGTWFPENVNDEMNDTSWNSLRKYFALLLNSNPNIIESLYVPEDKILYKHPAFDIILQNRDKFITKKCFGSFCGYAKTQLMKAKNLKTRIKNPVFEKLSPLEFVYYPYKQGARKIGPWLEENGLYQEHCGLTKVPHMDCTYNVFYDWGAHFLEKVLHTNTTWQQVPWEDFKKWVDSEWDEDKEKFKDPSLTAFFKVCMGKGFSIYAYDIDESVFIQQEELRKAYDFYAKPFKYHGIISRNGDSNEIRFSSIIKDEEPLIQISYNKDEYARHCQQYAEWNLWNKKHNEERFSLAVAAKYDRKNACHSARLMQMGIEIARGEGVKIDRSGIDKEFLMSIRRGELDEDAIMSYLESKDQEMKDAMANSTLPDEIDLEFLDDLMIQVRKEWLKQSGLFL